MNVEEVIIIGGGPCGLAAAIALKEVGIQSLIIEKGNVVDSIYRYPTHQTFFSSSEKLEIGDIAFIIENRKPVRNQALAYYREVVRRKELRINKFEKVENVEKREDGKFLVKTSKGEYTALHVIISTGYYDHPNYMCIPGEQLPKVFHYFKEGHPYFNCDVAVIGGKNSSVDAALELVKSGARVSVLYRGSDYSPSIKPWILPEFESLVRNGTIKMEFNANVDRITEDSVIYHVGDEEKVIKNDIVFAMTGYHPDHSFLASMGITIDKETGRPAYNEETMETNVKGLYIAGVLAAGNNANEIFIENGRFHGGLIAYHLAVKEK
ncbi:YpdA family putative bacillithiol disulfide reductase [Peribacillus frigoritolerans]|uniref:YpdA family putative bacillithiol disulfide reductase n=1 Tax=Peribacillus frigoritolerans TaxID=450367 RepID=UPI00164DD10B|nr:YpdA family putative bacillithiol disulfide reductase [Peribacillus frigoritolerans]MDG4845857.1 YpdA family putative bacillithiol disulfide reductase [Peribacillus frigoritolerans]QNK47873.1 YpdA family putative bacillithiol disulfide reductase [Brevibacterium sp. PAMC23299]